MRISFHLYAGTGTLQATCAHCGQPITNRPAIYAFSWGQEDGWYHVEHFKERYPLLAPTVEQQIVLAAHSSGIIKPTGYVEVRLREEGAAYDGKLFLPLFHASYATPQITWDDLMQMLHVLYEQWLVNPDYLFMHQEEARNFWQLVPEDYWRYQQPDPHSTLRVERFANRTTGKSIQVVPRYDLPQGEMRFAVLEPFPSDVGKLLRIEQTA